VVATDAERGVLMLRGAVPGSAGGWVLVRDAVKRKAPADLPFPAALRSDGSDEPALEAETSDESGAITETAASAEEGGAV
ncbi:MAG TPA: 50S ribosomal protein L3, partial [Stellaceae bacterium]|nr:50S ribosomal protein L3 [Stellaceae bacterium]